MGKTKKIFKTKLRKIEKFGKTLFILRKTGKRKLKETIRVVVNLLHETPPQVWFGLD
jgi:hypothetical protein